MAVYLGDNLLTGGGGAGGGIPQTEIFTSSGTWLVPQDVQDKITNDGHADIGIIAVGGANTTATQSGEVKNEILKLTSTTYSPSNIWADSNQPEINVTVGAAGGNSGIGYDANTSDISINSFTSDQALTAGTFSEDSNGDILIKSFSVLWGSGGMGSFNFSYSGTTQPTLTTQGGFPVSGLAGTYTKSIVTWSGNGTYMDGNLQMSATRYGSARNVGLLWNDSTDTLDIYNLSTTSVSWAADVTYVSAAGAPTIKAESGDGTVANFRNNPTSTEGYLGFSRFNSARPGSAGNQGAQGGYVQIFF